jgi:indole-3-glycerol phosphate synthase
VTTHRSAAPDVLDAIVAATRRRVSLQRGRESQALLETRASNYLPQPDRFRQAVSAAGRVNIVAECKRRSPSRGVLRQVYDPVAIAASYERGGAVALSVLTEPTFFDGALEHLRAVRAAVQLPLLRKDFIVDEYQLLEARANGADAVLLIVAALLDEELRHLQTRAAALGLATLVEVHDPGELDRAVACGAEMIGVNNRNLRTLEVDTSASEEVAARLPAGMIAVSESGLRTAADLARMRELGYHAFLIGERFMAAEDPGEALRLLSSQVALAISAQPADQLGARPS